MGTKLRFLQSANPKELEAQIEGLPFKVEIKSVYASGGKHWVAFTMLEKDTLVTDVFPSKDDEIPKPQKKSKRKTKAKIKK